MNKVWLSLHKEFSIIHFAKFIKMHKKIVVSFFFHMCITATVLLCADFTVTCTLAGQCNL